MSNILEKHVKQNKIKFILKVSFYLWIFSIIIIILQVFFHQGNVWKRLDSYLLLASMLLGLVSFSVYFLLLFFNSFFARVILITLFLSGGLFIAFLIYDSNEKVSLNKPTSIKNEISPSVSINSVTYTNKDITIDKLIELTNVERKKAGLRELNHNLLLDKAASLKLEHMIENNYWNHFSPDGVTPWSFILKAGYNYEYSGENLAKDFYSSKNIVNAWMSSPLHKENILSTNYSDIGIAIKEVISQGKKSILVVQMFGTPLSQNAVTTRPNISLNDVTTFLNNIRNSRDSWITAKGTVDDTKLNTLLDLFNRQISFLEHLESKFTQGQALSQDDVNLWNAAVQMSNESASLSNELNKR